MDLNFGTGTLLWRDLGMSIFLTFLIIMFFVTLIKSIINTEKESITDKGKKTSFLYLFWKPIIWLLLSFFFGITFYVAFGEGKKKGYEEPIETHSLSKSSTDLFDSIPTVEMIDLESKKHIDKHLIIIQSDSLQELEMQKIKEHRDKELEELLK